MLQLTQEFLQQYLIDNYFSDWNRVINIKAGDFLMKAGEYNGRLYLVRNGELIGISEEEGAGQEIIFTAGKNNFLGVYSFFSKTYNSLTSIKAVTDCELAYIDKYTKSVSETASLEKEFLPVVLTELMSRQNRLLQITQEKQQTLKMLLESQSLASLGQIAAGIAHELNNSIAVIARNSNWLSEQLSSQIFDKEQAVIFEAGLINGHFLSSRDVRKRKKELLSKFDFPDESASLLAQTGISDEKAGSMIKSDKEQIKKFFNTWEIGAALHDMILASQQSAHVVKSIKVLGAPNKSREPGVDLNGTIQNAITLLRHKVRNVKINLHLDPLPAITANQGEFVQVWTNLIKNAGDAMHGYKERDPELTITSESWPGQMIIKVKDNGPGIPENILTTIFQPNVTTKVSGLSFGLGLGLTIVKRIITEYNGKITVRSAKSGTQFTVFIPLGGNNE